MSSEDNKDDEMAQDPAMGEQPDEMAAEIDPGDESLEQGGDASAQADDAPKTYEELLSEVAVLKDQLLRAIAETENVRRRGERERSDLAKYSITGFAREILSVADNLNRAMDSVSEEARASNSELNTLYEGIEFTAKEIPVCFSRFGIEPVDALGQRFDHNFHQAMFEVEDPSQPVGTVVQVIQPGYKIHERLLRPAMVGVAKGGPKAEESAPVEEVAAEGKPGASASGPAAAYEKQAEAADAVAEETNPKLDTEL
ncbi:MAG: nucleotide exchange factor GrpE [Proteobacteria bacterium]|nr:nucleotide exchange factor GrpE [Pseudomonadota bacterium]